MAALAEINALDRAAFTQRLGAIYEHSPWVAERAWTARPFASVDALQAVMQAALLKADREKQLALIRAHPQLKGKLATPEELTDASRREQSSAGLDRCTAAQMEQLRELNAAYLQKFGFPFVVAVRGLNTEEIIVRMRERLAGNQDEEFAGALQQIGRIAHFRLGELIQ